VLCWCTNCRHNLARCSSQFGVGGPSASSSGPVRVSRRKVVRQSTFTPPAACFDFGIVWLCWVCFENAIRGREFCRKGLCAASVSMPAYPKKEGVHVDCPRRISTPADPMSSLTENFSFSLPCIQCLYVPLPAFLDRHSGPGQPQVDFSNSLGLHIGHAEVRIPNLATALFCQHPSDINFRPTSVPPFRLAV
jgi:hypothetical protein